MRRLIWIAVWVLVPLAIVGACYQSFENHMVPRRYPLSGRMVGCGRIQAAHPLRRHGFHQQ